MNVDAETLTGGVYWLNLVDEPAAAPGFTSTQLCEERNKTRGQSGLVQRVQIITANSSNVASLRACSISAPQHGAARLGSVCSHFHSRLVTVIQLLPFRPLLYWAQRGK